MPPSSSSSSSSGEFEKIALGIIVVAIVLAAILWCGAWIATEIFGGPRALPFLPASALVALAHFHAPSQAWPAAVRSSIPGAMAYWTATGVVVLALASAVFVSVLAWHTRHGAPKGRPAGAPGSREVAGAMGAKATQKAAQRLRNKS